MLIRLSHVCTLHSSKCELKILENCRKYRFKNCRVNIHPTFTAKVVYSQFPLWLTSPPPQCFHRLHLLVPLWERKSLFARGWEEESERKQHSKKSVNKFFVKLFWFFFLRNTDWCATTHIHNIESIKISQSTSPYLTLECSKSLRGDESPLMWNVLPFCSILHSRESS